MLKKPTINHVEESDLARLTNNRAHSTMVDTDSHYRTYTRWASETKHKPTKLLKEMSAKELNDTLTFFVLEIRYDRF